MPVMDEGVVVSCLKTFVVLVLRRPFLTAQNQLATAPILKILDCPVTVFILYVSYGSDIYD